jgi:hypothetical protein
MSVYQDQTDLQGQCASPQMAMIVNDHAAFCIEIGFFEDAISTLATALEMTEPLPDTSLTRSSCECKECTLESCISFSQRFSKLTPKQRCMFRCNHREEVSRPEHGGFEWPAIVTDEGNVYSQPIRVPREPREDGHAMNLLLVRLILTFNLALALHLQVLLCPNQQRGYNDECCASNLEDALDLYKKVFHSQLLDDVQGSLNSPCLKTVLANNLGLATISIARKNYCYCMQEL